MADPPTWTLTDGAAPAGFHTQHRETRDLDLFFHHQQELGSIDVRRDAGSTIIDLVADPTPIAESAQPMAIGDATAI